MIDFVDLPALGSTTFIGLTDTPIGFTSNWLVRVNAAGDALEYVDPSLLSGQSPYWQDDGNSPGTLPSVTGVLASIAIGDTVINNSDYCTIAGGLQNTIGVNSDYSNIGGGRTIVLSGQYSTITTFDAN